MAITLTQLADRLIRAGQAIRADAPRMVNQQAQTGMAIVQDRSINEGITVDGSKQPYSQKEVYRSSFAKAALNAAGRSWASDKTEKKGTWQGFREAQGRPSGSVNLFYTGRMWSSMHVVDAPSEGNVISAYVAPSDKEAAAKLLGNLKRYGNFMELTESEANRLRADLQQNITDFFKTLISRA